MRDKNQQLMFNEAELRLIKTVFGDNDDLLYAIRKVLLQGNLTDNEANSIRQQVTPEVFAVVKKRILPDLDLDAPFGQIGDLYRTLSSQLSSKDVEQMGPQFDAKKLEVDYLSQQFDVLKDMDKPLGTSVIRLDDMKMITTNHYVNYVNHTARDFLIGFVDSMLNMLKAIAGEKTETPEQQKERITRNSSK